MHMHTHICMPTHIYTCPHTCAHMHIYTRVHIHIHAHTCTCTDKQRAVGGHKSLRKVKAGQGPAGGAVSGGVGFPGAQEGHPEERKGEGRTPGCGSPGRRPSPAHQPQTVGTCLSLSRGWLAFPEAWGLALRCP